MANNRSLLGETWDFLKSHKAWWLAPTIILLLLISIMFMVSTSNSISMFIYALA